MSGYPACATDRRLPHAALAALVTEIFERCGMPAGHAALVADTLMRADLRGVHSHGVLRVPDYVHKLLEGGVEPAASPLVEKDAGAALLIDGGNSMGQIGAAFAMRQAIARAHSTQVAAAAVRGSNHCGAMAYYAMLALPEDMIGIAATNALPTMAPWGGVEKLLGINPLAVAIPAGEFPPIVFDAAFSAASHGKIRVYQQKGLAIPQGWSCDGEGRPTTDAAAALEGLLQPIGGYKGMGLALVMGILSAVLSGASFGTQLGNMVEGARPGADGHFFLALRVGAFEDAARFRRRVDEIIRQIRASRRAPEVERIFLPGEMEVETERRYRREGIPLNRATLAGLGATATRLGIDTAGLT